MGKLVLWNSMQKERERGRREGGRKLSKFCETICMTSHKNACVSVERELFRDSILKHRMVFGHWAPNFLKQKPTFKYKIDCRSP